MNLPGRRRREVGEVRFTSDQIGPYPLHVEVLLGGTSLDEGMFLNPETAREFVVATYRKAAAFGWEQRQVMVRVRLSVDARDFVQDATLDALARIQGKPR